MSSLPEKSNVFISGFMLANFLQLVNLEQKTCTLKVSSKDKFGYLYFNNGELINAEADGMDGEQAATTIISWQNAQAEVENSCKTERKVYTPLMHILLNSTRHADENGTIRGHPDILDEAIQQAEAHHLKKAKLLLSKVLKQDNRNHKAWLWFSRITSSVKAVGGSLNNALKIAPDDPEVIKEVQKFHQAKSQLQEEPFPRCPFCWSPVKRKAIICPVCKCHLMIHSQFFETEHNGSEEIQQEAIDRYTRVLERENSSQSHYWLGMVYLNMDNFEDALNHLDFASKLSSGVEFYSKQLNVLVKYMASSGAVLSTELKSAGKDTESACMPLLEKIRKKILVVEDSSTIRKVISITLSQKGYDIVEAGDGLEALSRLNETKPDLVLLDIILPKMDGYQILSIIKENSEFKHIPVILLTSKDGIINKVKGKVAGSSAYLTKPFDPSQLVETIERYI
ncbi:MAG: response regulator [Desulfobacterales bacterium]|jgi:twitching motility two-component system response regulator PilG